MADPENNESRSKESVPCLDVIVSNCEDTGPNMGVTVLYFVLSAPLNTSSCDWTQLSGSEAKGFGMCLADKPLFLDFTEPSLDATENLKIAISP